MPPRHGRPNTALPASLRQIISIPSERALNRFDPWNSASTGHQVADGGPAGGAAVQFALQFGGEGRTSARTTTRPGGGGGELMLLSEEERHTQGNREKDIREYFGVGKRKRVAEAVEDTGKMKRRRESMEKLEPRQGDSSVDYSNRRDDTRPSLPPRPSSSSSSAVPLPEEQETKAEQNISRDDEPPPSAQQRQHQSPPPSSPSSPPPNKHPPGRKPGIFSDLTIYINGSTMPLISDHKLKRLLIANGACIAIALTRRSVTHVILGTPNKVASSDSVGVGDGGSGGGLAAGKLQREIQRVGGEGVKFVGVEWALECLRVGRRVAEARYATLHMASAKQPSVLGHFAASA